MNEAQLVRRIKTFLEENLAGPVLVWKHADRITAGIPDLSISYRTRTVWVEVKMLDKLDRSSKTRKSIDPRQLASLFRLAQTGVPVRYLIGFREKEETRLCIATPFEVLVWYQRGRMLGRTNGTGRTLSDDLGWFVRGVLMKEDP